MVFSMQDGRPEKEKLNANAFKKKQGEAFLCVKGADVDKVVLTADWPPADESNVAGPLGQRDKRSCWIDGHKKGARCTWKALCSKKAKRVVRR